MTALEALILGALEGFSEFLPISSTGHLILASYLLGIEQNTFFTSFEIAIQLGAILAVLFFYFRSFFNIEILKRLLIAFIPTALVGLAFYKIMKTYFLGNELVVVIALALGGIALIALEIFHREKESVVSDMASIPYSTALLVGVFQSIAIIPRVSRSGATILGGLLLGLRRTTIVEFSFLLAVPTMVSATGLDILKSYSYFSISDITPLLIGLISAFLVALIVIKYFLKYVRTHSFIPFGIYRILIAGVFWMVVF